MNKIYIGFLALIIVGLNLTDSVSASGSFPDDYSIVSQVSITSVTTNAQGNTLERGSELIINLELSEALTITGGNPYLELAPNGNQALCSVVATAQNTLSCSYTIGNTDSTATMPLSINGIASNGAIATNAEGIEISVESLFTSQSPNLNNITIANDSSENVKIQVPETDFTDGSAVDNTLDPEKSTNPFSTLETFALTGVILILVYFVYIIVNRRKD